MNFKTILPIVFILGAGFYLFTSKVNSDFTIFSLTIIWILIVRVYSLKSNSNFKLAFAYLILLFIFFIFDRSLGAVEKISVWIYLILLTGLIHQFFEVRKKSGVRS